jgi:nucleoside-diphosphate kinase
MVIDEGDIKLSFIAEWFDPHPQVVDRFLLKYYPKSQEVEMKDLKATRKFLKRTKIKLPRDDFILDAVVVFFSRDL